MSGILPHARSSSSPVPTPSLSSHRAPSQINSLFALSGALQEMEAARLSLPITSLDGLMRALNQLPAALPAVSV